MQRLLAHTHFSIGQLCSTGHSRLHCSGHGALAALPVRLRQPAVNALQAAWTSGRHARSPATRRSLAPAFIQDPCCFVCPTAHTALPCPPALSAADSGAPLTWCRKCFAPCLCPPCQPPLPGRPSRRCSGASPGRRGSGVPGSGCGPRGWERFPAACTSSAPPAPKGPRPIRQTSAELDCRERRHAAAESRAPDGVKGRMQRQGLPTCKLDNRQAPAGWEVAARLLAVDRTTVFLLTANDPHSSNNHSRRSSSSSTLRCMDFPGEDKG